VPGRPVFLLPGEHAESFRDEHGGEWDEQHGEL